MRLGCLPASRWDSQEHVDAQKRRRFSSNEVQVPIAAQLAHAAERAQRDRSVYLGDVARAR